MLQIYNKKINFISLVLLVFLLIFTNCSKKEGALDDKVLIETNPDKKAREFAETRSWELILNGLLEEYNDLIKSYSMLK